MAAVEHEIVPAEDITRTGRETAADAPPRRIPFIQVTNPELQEHESRMLPSRAERKENLNNLEVSCDAQCGKTLPRSEIKVCSRCRQARYCSPACQRAHWRAHRIECGEGTMSDLLLKLAERALAVPKIVEHFWMIAIVTLDMLVHPGAAADTAIRVQCRKEPADFMGYLRKMMDTGEHDANAQVCLKYAEFSRVPLAEAPARTQKAAAMVRERLRKERRDADGNPALPDDPVVTYYFATEEDPTGKDGLVSAAWVLPLWTLAYMASNPKSILRSAMFGDREVPVNMISLTDALDSIIRNDKRNKLRLRGYPTKERPKPAENEPQPLVIRIPDEESGNDDCTHDH
ncbi:hypothetical protein WOLCODRAFT_137075 [Wolfiporia cocos MD-104 SS10]|uniref:MYND-type domain-containing protein n=1 Tax=Wolfiporia cocos (strain MD-104) TaxID=742152 RepID=A0A2H3JM27_WOLCO|nr:hypothetical protein WOLCODRAFT_137075 [Wolfiporia cocos MD-104 SS10]